MNQDELIHTICYASTPLEALAAFSANKEKLSDFKVVWSDQNGNNCYLPRTHNIEDTYFIKSPFIHENFFVFDRRTVELLEVGKQAAFSIDFSISIDANALSYIYRLINGKLSKNLVNATQQLIYYLSNPRIQYDPEPYMIENMMKLSEQNEDHAHFFQETLTAYQILKTLDHQHFDKTGNIRSIDGESAVLKESERLFEEGMEISKDLKRNKHKFNLYNSIYAISLKISALHIASNLNPNQKFEELIQFCHEKVGAMFLRELHYALLLFNKNQQLTDFFGKIQKGRKNIIAEIRNLSWDLFHIRELERKCSSPSSYRGNYFLPSLVSTDKKMIALINKYPLKSLAFEENGTTVYPFPQKNGFDYPFVSDAQNQEFSQLIVKNASVRKDVSYRQECQDLLLEVIAKLESQF